MYWDSGPRPRGQESSSRKSSYLRPQQLEERTEEYGTDTLLLSRDCSGGNKNERESEVVVGAEQGRVRDDKRHPPGFYTPAIRIRAGSCKQYRPKFFQARNHVYR